MIIKFNTQHKHTWKACFMEFHDGFGTVSSLHCDLFGSPVVFNVLLQYKRQATSLKSPTEVFFFFFNNCAFTYR